MSHHRRQKWLAFWLSLWVPGAGQVYARHWTCGLWLSVWLGYGWGTSELLARFGDDRGLRFATGVGGAMLALAGAEHAKRRLEKRARQPIVADAAETTAPCSRDDTVRSAGRRIRLRIDLPLNEPIARAWTRIADLPTFLTLDPFHEQVILLSRELRAGAELALNHNAFGIRFPRFGKLLRWRCEHGYSFSDLAAQRSWDIFPHVFHVDLTPKEKENGDACWLTIRVCGRWDSRWIPAVAGRLWVRWVCYEHARLIRKGLGNE